MKPFAEQNFYEILDVPPDARPEDIESAFDRAMEYYGPDSLATYSLADPSEAASLTKLIEEAYLTLMDPDLRRTYDAQIGLLEAPKAESAADTAQLAFGQIIEAARHFPWPGSRPELEGEDALQPPQALPAPRPEREKVDDPAPRVESVREQVPELEGLAEMPLTSAACAAFEAPAVPVPAVESEPEPEPVRPALIPVVEEPEVAAPPPPTKPPPEERRAPPARPAAKMPEIPPNAAFNGELLRRVREAKGLSLRDLAERTKVSTTHLDNIEADRYEELPAAVYLRGFLMLIARELKLDPLKVSKSYIDQAAKARKDAG